MEHYKKKIQNNLEINYKSKKSLLFIIYLSIFAFLLNLFNVYLGVMNVQGLATLDIDSIKGIIAALISTSALIIIVIDYNCGFFFSIGIMIVNLTTMLTYMIRSGSADVIPGMINNILMISCIVVISRQFNLMEQKIMVDEITLLYSRTGFKRMSEKSIEKKRLGYIMLVQIRNFREVNDNHGHEYGDIVLKKIGKRIQDLIGEDGIPARLDGTQFAVAIFNNVDVKEFSEKLLHEIRQKIEIEKNGDVVNCYLDCSIGYSAYGTDATDVSVLIQYADIAMYHPAQKASDRIRAFNGSMEEELKREARIHSNIKNSLENDYFYMVYQPQYFTTDKNLRGFESLIRCKMPDGESICPGEFIAVAEKTDFILAIDEYVLNRTMQEFAPIVKDNPEVVLSVNVSAKTISSPTFIDMLKAILEKNAYPPENLEIEITEYSFAESRTQTIINVTELKKMGAHLALDDFGTGYTSIEQLLKLDVDLLKIDKSLVDEIGHPGNKLGREFLESVIYMGHLKKSWVIAEGVEDEKQLSVLMDYDCDLVQGFIWGKPMMLEDARNLSEALA